MNYKKKGKDNNGGTALYLVLVIMTGFLVVVLTAAEIINKDIKMNREQMESTRAYFAAETGAEQIIYHIRSEAFPTIDETTCTTTDAKICFNSNSEYGNITGCTTDLMPSCPNFDEIKLNNGAVYSILYNFKSPTTTLTCLGSFGGANRKLELSY